jgi:hypothetical protein
LIRREDDGRIDVTDGLHRDLVTLQDLLTASSNWRLTPEQWEAAMKALEDLAQTLVDEDREGIGKALLQLGVFGDRRVATSIDDPRNVDAPEPFRVRSGQLVPVIAAYEQARARPRAERQSGKDAH